MRRSFKAWLVGAALAALSTTLAVAQPITQNQITGSECWSAGQGPGGPSTFVCVNPVRGSTADTVLSAVSGSFTVGTASGNFTVAAGSSGTNVGAGGGSVIITAQPSAGTITLPPNPVVDGAWVRICNGTNAAWTTNAVTVAANAGQTLVPTGAAITLTTQAAASCTGYQWSQGLLSWYKVP